MLSWVTSFPSYLLAFITLALPIIIHLLSKNKGKPIAVGTLKFFQQLKPVKMTQVKLVERLLLALRLLMLICATLLTAQLWWLGDGSAKKEDLYLITSSWLNFSSREEKRELATKLNEDNAYILESRLKPLSKEQLLTWEKTNFSHHKPLWSALNTAHYTLPKNALFHVYTDTLAVNFIGKPVHISQPIQWYVTNNENEVTLNSSKSPLQVTIVADTDRAHSVLRIKQALTILKSALIPELSLNIIENQPITNKGSSEYGTTSAIIKDSDWLFYLSSDEKSSLLQRALNQGVNIFIDAKESHQNLNKTLENTMVSSENELFLEDALIHKRGKRTPINALLTLADLDDNYQSEALWHTENNFVALEKHQVFKEDKTQIIYQLNSRLEPEWSSFAEQPQFVHVLLSLLQNTKTDEKHMLGLDSSLTDTRVSFAQIQTLDTTENTLRAAETKKILTLLAYKEQLLTQWLIIFLVVLWCFERLLSERRLSERNTDKNSKNNQNSPVKSESV